jgi:hypothetical protein
MKKRILTVTILTLCTTTAFAQIDPNENGIGIYADVGGMTNEVQIEAGTPLEVYLLLTRLTGPTLLNGFECEIVVPDNVTIWGWNLPVTGSVSVSSPPAFGVAFPPIPYQTINHVMTIIITPLDDQPAQFYIKEYPNSRGVTDPQALDANSDVINLRPWPSGCSFPTFSINPVALPMENTSWGEMKALYR